MWDVKKPSFSYNRPSACWPSPNGPAGQKNLQTQFIQVLGTPLDHNPRGVTQNPHSDFVKNLSLCHLTKMLINWSNQLLRLGFQSIIQFTILHQPLYSKFWVHWTASFEMQRSKNLWATNLKCSSPLEIQTQFQKGFRSCNDKNLGSVGQRVAKVQAIKL